MNCAIPFNWTKIVKVRAKINLNIEIVSKVFLNYFLMKNKILISQNKLPICMLLMDIINGWQTVKDVSKLALWKLTISKINQSYSNNGAYTFLNLCIFWAIITLLLQYCIRRRIGYLKYYLYKPNISTILLHSRNTDLKSNASLGKQTSI